MKSGALNPRLCEGCIDAGLPQRNTMYYFRRIRVVETKPEHGEAAAQAIAAHSDDSNAHEYCDTVGVGDIDIQSCILGRERMSRRDARKMFEQAAQTEYIQHENYEIMLRAEAEERLREREREDSELVEIVQSAKETIDDTHEFLIQNITDEPSIPDGNSAAGIVLKKLEAVSSRRNKVLDKIHKSIRNTTLEELSKEMRSLPNTSTKSKSTGLTAGKGVASTSIRKQAKDAEAKLYGLHSERMSALEALKRRKEQDETTESDVDQEEGLDVDSLEEDGGKQHPRGEPLHRQDLPKEDIQVNIADGVGECDAATKEERLAFLRAFSAHTSQAISSLKCCRCRFDQTMSQTATDKKGNLAQLEKHVKGKVHTRREELIRAFHELKIAGCTGGASYSLCPDRSFKSAAKWLVHLERHH